jgi:hypothetical protein
VDTSGYGGRRLRKVTVVYTNDPRSPELKLTIAGKVEEVVTINPRRVVFQGAAGQPLTRTVVIMPRKGYPFKVIDTQTDKPNNFRYDLKQVDGGGNSYYLLTVENLRQKKGRYSGYIIMKTDSKFIPKLYVAVTGHIFEKTAAGK